MKNHLFVLLFSITIPTIGQLKADINLMDSIIQMNDEKLINISSEISTRSRDLYVDNEWRYGTVLTVDDEIIHISGRINVMRGYLECKVNNRLRKIASGRVKLVKINDQLFIPVQGNEIDGGGINTFMEVLSPGNFTLLRNYYIDIETRRGDSLNPGLTGDQSAILKTNLFYSDDLKNFSTLKSTKNGVLNLLSDKANQIEELIEVNKLRFNSDRDITIIFNYYNSI